MSGIKSVVSSQRLQNIVIGAIALIPLIFIVNWRLYPSASLALLLIAAYVVPSIIIGKREEFSGGTPVGLKDVISCWFINIVFFTLMCVLLASFLRLCPGVVSGSANFVIFYFLAMHNVLYRCPSFRIMGLYAHSPGVSGRLRLLLLNYLLLFPLWLIEFGNVWNFKSDWLTKLTCLSFIIWVFHFVSRWISFAEQSPLEKILKIQTMKIASSNIPLDQK